MLAVPTLVVRGQESKKLTKETYEKMISVNPLIEGVEIAGAGHWVHADQPEAFLNAIKNFAGGF